MKENTTSLREQDCETCGKRFSYRQAKDRGPRRFCSRACINYVRVGKVTRTCPTCSATFECFPSVPQRFCSRGCLRRGKAHVRPPCQPRPCVLCGLDYQPNSARQKYCKICVPTKAARMRQSRYGSGRATKRQILYGLSEQRWAEMLARFDGQCWICRQRPATCVDHCHESGRVRGALCRVCNMVPSYVERPGWWDTATAYLEEVG